MLTDQISLHGCFYFERFWTICVYLMQRKKIEVWFVSLVSREFHGVEPTTFLSTNWQKNTKKI